MRVGRPGKGVGHVEKLSGSEYAKERLRVILEVTSGALSRKEGAERLGLSESSYRGIRDRGLQGAVTSLEPRPPGRPRKECTGELSEAEAQALFDLRAMIELSRLREEIALLMPELVCRDGVRIPPRGRVAGKRRTLRGSKRG